MKLNTKNIFLSSSQKTKTKIQKKAKINSPFINSDKVTKKKYNSNKNINSNKNKKILQNSNKKVNPFISSSDKNQNTKYSKLSKFSTQKIKINLDFDEKNDKNDLFEDSYVNNMALTSESDTNNYKGNKDNINYKQNQNELDFEELNNLFKKSSLKSTIIVDNNGNNNLDFEQKKIIIDYFNKKRNNVNNINNINNNKKYLNNFQRSKTRKISTQIYRENNLFNKIYRLKSATIDNINKSINKNKKIEKNQNKNIIENQNKNNYINLEINYDIDNKNRKKYKKTKSTKINSCFFINNEKYNIKKEEKTKVEKDKNSFLENNSHFSFDSSFLGSSMDEDFYKTLNNNN